MTLALSAEEVIELTGYRMKSRQIAWLRRNGIRFFVAKDGHPRVPRSAIEGAKAPSPARPDFEALRSLR